MYLLFMVRVLFRVLKNTTNTNSLPKLLSLIAFLDGPMTQL